MDETIEQVRAERDALRAAVIAMLAKWEAVQPELNKVTSIAWIHGNRYNGPTIGEEMKVLQALVEEPSS